MTHRAIHWTATALLAAAVVFAVGCDAFDINVGTKEPIKLDPIKVDLNMRVDVYQYDGKSDDEKKKEVANRNDAAKRMRDRGAEIQELKNNRLVGENHLGLLSIRNQPAGDYGDYVVRTVDAENADRIFLMTDISNRSGDALAAVRRDQWQKRSARLRGHPRGVGRGRGGCGRLVSVDRGEGVEVSSRRIAITRHPQSEAATRQRTSSKCFLRSPRLSHHRGRGAGSAW